MTIYETFKKSVISELSKKVRKSIPNVLNTIADYQNDQKHKKYQDNFMKLADFLSENSEDVIYKCAESAVSNFKSQIDCFKEQNDDLSISISNAAKIFLQYNNALPNSADEFFAQLSQNILIEQLVVSLEKIKKENIYEPLADEIIAYML